MVAGILETYAARGVFRGFTRGTVHAGRATFKIVWHRERLFQLILTVPRRTLRFPLVLPEIPAGSDMYRDLQRFIEARHSETLPEHRRIDITKARAQCANRSGDVSLTLTVLNGDYEYGVRKLVNLVHEIFMVFLLDGRYYDYAVKIFDLDPDRM